MNTKGPDSVGHRGFMIQNVDLPKRSASWRATHPLKASDLNLPKWPCYVRSDGLQANSNGLHLLASYKNVRRACRAVSTFWPSGPGLRDPNSDASARHKAPPRRSHPPGPGCDPRNWRLRVGELGGVWWSLGPRSGFSTRKSTGIPQHLKD